MSTQLKSNVEDIAQTRFFGGINRGVCVQLTQPRSKTNLPSKLNVGDEIWCSLQLTKEQAKALAHDLLAFAEGREEPETFLE